MGTSFAMHLQVVLTMSTQIFRIGLWLYAKFDGSVDYLVERFGWIWLEQPDDAWRKKYPHVTKKIDELESRLNLIEDVQEMDDIRLKDLEKKI